MIDLESLLARSRLAQAAWARTPLKTRLAAVERFRRCLVERADRLAAAYPADRHAGETYSAEILPLADACQFLERTATRTLAPEWLSQTGSSFWNRPIRVVQFREPAGVVLVIAPANYPLFLPGVQLLQAIAAGNSVVWKPAPGTSQLTEAIRELIADSDWPADLVQWLDEDPAEAEQLMQRGVDHVTLTGSSQTGRRVLQTLGQTLTPATMELSGCDSVIVLSSANLQLAAKAVAFGLCWNHGATCMAPRKVFVVEQLREQLEQLVLVELERSSSAAGHRQAPTESASDRLSESAAAGRLSSAVHARDRLVQRAIDAGAVLLAGSANGSYAAAVVLRGTSTVVRDWDADVFVPALMVVGIDGPDDAISVINGARYRLSAAVFGDAEDAYPIAARLNVGCVLINDVIAASADPRVAFGGRGESGFGVTRGSAGLLEFTRLKTVVERRGRVYRHLERPGPPRADQLAALLQLSHGRSWWARWKGLWALIQSTRQPPLEKANAGHQTEQVIAVEPATYNVNRHADQDKSSAAESRGVEKKAGTAGETAITEESAAF